MWVTSHINITDNETADKVADLMPKTIFHPTITNIPTK